MKKSLSSKEVLVLGPYVNRAVLCSEVIAVFHLAVPHTPALPKTSGFVIGFFWIAVVL